MNASRVWIFWSPHRRWNRWGVSSADRDTVWVRNRNAAMEKAFSRIGGREKPHTIREDSSGNATLIAKGGEA